jgi:hypothetical protein
MIVDSLRVQHIGISVIELKEKKKRKPHAFFAWLLPLGGMPLLEETEPHPKS